MALYPIEFRPYATNDLVRIGAAYDGGYVLPERIILATRGLLSFGLSDEWQFEDELSRKAGVRVVCFDPSVTGAFWLRRSVTQFCRGILERDGHRVVRGLRFLKYWRFFKGKGHQHIKKAIGYSSSRTISLQQAIELAKLDEPLFLKMDIEGCEYRVLPDLVGLRHRFVGLAIEFHDIDIHEARIREFIAAIDDTFLLVHFHANSHTATGPEGSALVIEMSFMNRTLLRPGESPVPLNLPIMGLDSPNLPHEAEAVVGFRQAVNRCRDGR